MQVILVILVSRKKQVRRLDGISLLSAQCIVCTSTYFASGRANKWEERAGRRLLRSDSPTERKNILPKVVVVETKKFWAWQVRKEVSSPLCSLLRVVVVVKLFVPVMLGEREVEERELLLRRGRFAPSL